MTLLSLDAQTLGGFDQTTYLADFFAGLAGGSTNFYGGTPDSAFGGTYYMNGSQVLTTYTDTDQVVVMGGAGIAYDFIHNGPSFGHGITGAADSVTFGAWVDGTCFTFSVYQNY